MMMDSFPRYEKFTGKIWFECVTNTFFPHLSDT